MKQLFVLGILCCILYWPLNAQVDISDKVVTYHAKELALGEMLKELSGKYAIQFFYSENKIPVNHRISVDVENQPLSVLLEKIKAITNINYQFEGSKVILFVSGDYTPPKNNVSLYGFVEDSVTGERLIGAYIIAKDLARGTAANAYGYYSLPLQTGEHIIRCSYVGYLPVESHVKLEEDACISFKLKSDLQPLEEIKVSGKELNNILYTRAGIDQVPIKMMRTYPALLGENDPIQFLKLLPGIQSGSEASNGLYVRGSPPSQTSFLLDDAPLFDISHVSGIFSTINQDAVKEINIYKSQLPAKYGGVLASVVDIRLRDGNNQHYSVKGGIGTIASRLTFEGPIIKNKASFIISGRRSYLDQIVKLFNQESSGAGDIYFYDLNGKINYSLNTRNRFYLSSYFSKDNVMVNKEGTEWANSMGSFRWNHIYSSKLFSNLTITGSKYIQKFENNEVDHYTVKTNMQNYALKYDFSYFPSEKCQLDFGLNTNYQAILPIEIIVNDNSRIIAPYYSGISDRSIYNVYAESILNLTSRLAIESGIRLNYVFYYAKNSEKHNLKPEPFFTARYKISSLVSVKTGISRNYQFYHGASIISMILPFDRVIFSNDVLKPQYSNNFSLGCFYNAVNDNFEFSCEGYYKKLYNQCRFKITDDLIYGKNYDDMAIIGHSEAYGIELSLRRNVGRLNGLLSYTLAKVRKKEDGINGNQTYDPYYDRTHNLAINLNYQLSKHINLVSAWVFMSGCPYNMPVGKYEINGSSVPMYEIESLKISHMPSYHHLDIGMQFKFGSKNRLKHSFSLYFYNVYFRKNMLYYTYRNVYDGNPTTIVSDNTQSKSFNTVGFYLFQFVPAFSYEFKFD
jgi:hypothetical protein